MSKNIGKTDYIQQLDQKAARVRSYVRRAEDLNRENNGEHTLEEANLYYDASKICAEIANANNENDNIYTLWMGHKKTYETKFKQIAAELMPQNEQESGKTGTVSVSKPTPKATTKTKSGFTTRQAIDKILPAEVIESWHVQDDKMPKDGFKAVTGMKSLKRKLLEEVATTGWSKTDAALKISPVKCYFLYGPPGTGKTFIIKSLARELKNKMKGEEFNFMHLLGSNIHAGYVGVAEKIVTAAFREAADKAPCLIFMDEIDNLCRKRDGKVETHVERITTAFLEALNELRDSGKQVIFMGATNHPGKVDEAMMNRISLIEVPMPDAEARAAFFNRELSALKLEEGLTYEYMAEKTENYSYRDMERIRDNIGTKIRSLAIKKYSIMTPDGELDLEASDEKASQAIISGEFPLTASMFNKTIKQTPPTDVSDIRQELSKFRERFPADDDKDENEDENEG